MKKLLAVLIVLGATSSAWAQGVVPDGLTGLWRFQTEADKLKATIGVDLVSSHLNNSAWFPGPWTMIGYDWHAGYYADGGVVQERSWDYLTVNPSFTSNGGSEYGYVNEYTVMIDYVQTQTGRNSLFQTAQTGTGNDGDLWTDSNGYIGSDALGYSAMSYDTSKWHRIVWSVKNGDEFGQDGFFRVFVDGVLFLDALGQSRDGRYSLYTDAFHLFADDSWEDMWGLVGTVATWNAPLTNEEIAQMGGWIGDATMPTWLYLPTVYRVPGDTDDNHIVDDTDAKVVAAHWGDTGLAGGYTVGDFNDDGVVNALDASIQAAHWGDYSSLGESVAVPEPSAVVLLILSAAAFLLRRSRRLL